VLAQERAACLRGATFVAVVRDSPTRWPADEHIHRDCFIPVIVITDSDEADYDMERRDGCDGEQRNGLS
jgi:hypothetical protein